MPKDIYGNLQNFHLKIYSTELPGLFNYIRSLKGGSIIPIVFGGVGLPNKQHTYGEKFSIVMNFSVSLRIVKFQNFIVRVILYFESA